MNGIPNYGEQRDTLQKATVIRTQEVALQSLDEEYERAKTHINETNDLRVLKSMCKRIGMLNNPRGSGKKFKTIEPSG